MDYYEFLKTKQLRFQSTGIEIDEGLIHPLLFPFQRDLTCWAIRKGRAAIFADTGLGKTFMQLEWARLLGKRTLIIAPLSVARQTVREARNIDLDIHYVRGQNEITDDLLWITDYEMIKAFDFSQFGAIVLDESSILKAISGHTRRLLTKLCQSVPYRLCCTATPAPNDYIELGNHAEFLGICKRSEMLAMFFINANKEHTFFVNDKAYRRKGTNKGGQEWRLKHHAEDSFYEWLSSWSAAMIRPSDLGYDDEGFILPDLNIYPEFVKSEYKPSDELFFTRLKGVKHRAEVRRQTLPARLKRLTELVNGNDDQWIVWVGLDEESRIATESLDNAIEVKGSNSPEYKATAFEEFQDGLHRVLVTKGKIGGFGMNFQNAHRMAFFGLSDSWEMWYQCIRRQWRYLQKFPVDVHIIIADIEGAIYHNVMRKDAQAKRLRDGLIRHIKYHEMKELNMIADIDQNDYEVRTVAGENWTAMLGDACERLSELEDESIDLSIYSPPFADLYTYSNSERDLGNSRDWTEFFSHYSFIIREILRITKSGRLTCVHTSDIPALHQSDGYIGIKDFPGEVIRAYESEGWIFHGRAFVQKNPQAQAIRTHSKALLFVQLRKDSSDSRPCLIDQILIFKKLGENAVPVNPVKNEEMNNETWIEWAHGIWTGISETDTLQFSPARDSDDEKHICPLQLPTIERCVKLYSNPGETVLSPFAGIGSEGHEAIRFGRKFIGIELKRSYFDVMIKNLNKAQIESTQVDLFDLAGIEL
jgi:DNA modification methylase